MEDQQYPKRSGQLEGTHLVKIEEMTKKIQKSVDASKKCSNGDFIIAARTDARQLEGLEKVIDRLKKYVDAGADMVLPNGLLSKEEFLQVAKELKNYGPKGGALLMANMTEFGKTPIIPLKDFKEMGYNCVLYPVAPLRVAMKAIDEFLVDFKQKGSQKDYINKYFLLIIFFLKKNIVIECNREKNFINCYHIHLVLSGIIPRLIAEILNIQYKKRNFLCTKILKI